MAFGKRQGWKEGAVVIPGRKRIPCSVVSQTAASVVFECPALVDVPYLFDVVIDGTSWSCELKSQRGHQITAAAVPARIEQERPVQPDPETVLEQAGQWAGWRPSKGFKT
jgi:hypothetical protein